MMKLWLKNDYFRVGVILGILLLSIFIVLPRTQIKYDSTYFKIDTSVGGYYLDFGGGRYALDLRDFKKGLDLEGGVRIVLRANMDNIAASERDAALDSAREIIERRVNFLGVSEPYIVPVKSENDYRIFVEIPGVTDIAAALDLVGRTAQISFKQLKENVPWDGTQAQEYFFDPEVWEETGVTGGDLLGADVLLSQGQATGTEPQIRIRFTNAGRTKFSEIARENINKPIAIFLDDDPLPLSMPVVSGEFASGVFDDPVISGTFDINSANNLSLQIRAGALPVPVEVLQQEKVGASLGEESIRASYKAGLIGFSLILIFMFVLYGKLGLVADFALVLYALIVLALFKLIPVVLTLPGIAGFLLSVGLAVDANILIFERVREELKAGRPRSLAIKFGFERAWPSIRDANVSSLLTSAILFYLGSGPIRGFALTLFVGVIISLFTAIFVVRTLIRVTKLDKVSENRLSRLRNLNFINLRRVAK